MKTRPTAICAALVLIVAALPLTSLAQGVEAARVQETVATARFKRAAPYRVGVAAGYLGNSWVVFCVQHIRYEAARHKEISEVLVTDAGFNPGKQVADIEYLISKNVDLILYWPVDEKAIQPALEKAVVKGIPTVNTGGASPTVPGPWRTPSSTRSSSATWSPANSSRTCAARARSSRCSRSRGRRRRWTSWRPSGPR